ncbi:DNA glycosylase [Bacillus coahuilensis m2-6]|uniref:A/G-specific adenine glycosylase n=1 Tax=Bacillus coahuilensis TaxID=408580 RepID=UPI0001850B43|nr:A/G-specific adenine glycosylase [Bacillus coahuilensis]KUP09699.1 DNA glycosylase [Bacillus coahuilensis m2-6]
MKKFDLPQLEDFPIESFQQDLIGWFTEEMRDLPWRKDQDPYKVWVSEIMLQQTRVDTVIPYFNRFIEQFPTIEALATADEEKVLKAWEGLGYYSRVRNLQAAVQEVHETYGGVVPNTPEEISKLKGVGPYTTGAVLSIAYGVPEPAVDGNVMRVISRVLSIWDDIAKPSSRKIFEQAIRELISHKNPSYFNQALMELGALVCTPTSPSCLLCPVREHCHAFHEGVTSELPVKTKKKSTKRVRLASAILVDSSGKIVLHKRPSSGLLANLWEFPMAEVNAFSTPREDLVRFIQEHYSEQVELEKVQLDKIEHIFSHLVWEVDVFVGTISGSIKESGARFVTADELEGDYALPVSHQKMWKSFKAERK